MEASLSELADLMRLEATLMRWVTLCSNWFRTSSGLRAELRPERLHLVAIVYVRETRSEKRSSDGPNGRSVPVPTPRCAGTSECRRLH